MRGSSDVDNVQRMVALIGRSFADRITLKTVSTALGGQSRLHGRRFKEIVGVGFHEYLTRVRLQRATQLIASGVKIEAVALDVGYRSKKNFYRQFARLFGATPEKFRRASPPLPINTPAGTAMPGAHHHDTQTLDEGIVSRSPALVNVLVRLERGASVDTTVLITGETGTGKELVARELHRRSRRRSQPLVAVNLAAIPEPLVAAELFGHEQGAFTGAVQRRIGVFELADRGTLFLDEVTELSLDMQAALLRMIQEGEFERLGAVRTRRVDVRLVAATNGSLEQAVDNHRFRADLFYRLSLFPIHLPPMRERVEDIQPLAEYFLQRLGARLKRPFAGIEPDALAQLQAFSWPGNIRQLQHVIEQSAILSDGPLLRIPRSLLVETKAGVRGRLEACRPARP